MPTAIETRFLCDVCQKTAFVTLNANGTDIAVCENCLQEYETYKLQFPDATLKDFAEYKKMSP